MKKYIIDINKMKMKVKPKQFGPQMILKIIGNLIIHNKHMSTIKSI